MSDQENKRERKQVALAPTSIVVAHEEQHADPYEVNAMFYDGLDVTFRATTAEELATLIREFDSQFSTTVEARLTGARYTS